MQIEAQKVVTLNYTLTDNEGNLIDESKDGSFAYLHGASNIIPGLENALVGKTAGDALSVAVEPAEGYGERDPAKTQAVPRTCSRKTLTSMSACSFTPRAPTVKPWSLPWPQWKMNRSLLTAIILWPV